MGIDTYAYGIIVYELVEREQFFGSTLFFSDIQDFVINKKRPAITPEAPPQMKTIIERCWVSDSLLSFCSLFQARGPCSAVPGKFLDQF